MKTVLTSLFLLLTNLAFAQFPGGGPGGPGGQGGNSDGVRRRTQTEAIPGVAEEPTPKGNSKITGYVVDSSLTKAVEFASVALYTKATNKPVDGTAANEKGKFTLTRVAAGEYKLLVTFIGFNTKTIDNLTIEKGKDVDLGVIKLSPNVKTLDEVTITGQASMIEERVDRLVYNAEKDLTSKGGDAADILRKVPMLTVDLDGNVQLRGSSNIRVLINNKPSTIIASSVADALKQIPADLIKTVEVITSPSAKYDAEGSAGIINIVTKKNTLQGLTLNLDTGIGIRGSNMGLNSNYRKGNLGLSLGGFGRAFYNKAESSSDQSTLLGGNRILSSQTGKANDRGLFGHYTLGMDYDISKTQSITTSVRYGTRNFLQEQNLMTELYQNSLLLNTSDRDVSTKNLSGTVDVNLDYLRTFKAGQEWSISTLYSRNDNTNNFDADLLSGIGDLTGRQRNINNSTNQEITLQTDYQTPIKKNQMLEFGGKGIFRQVNSNFQYLFANPSGDFSSEINRPAGSLDYSQNIAAGYVSYTYSTPNKYTFKLGTRYEYTTIDAKTREAGNIAIPAYGNLVPSINVSKSLKAGTTLKAAYNRRIQRPGIQQLNPNVNAANPQNISVGNPDLRPELTDNFELSLSTSIKKTYLNMSVFSRFTNNAISQVRIPSDSLPGALITTFQNIGHQQTYGVNVFANTNITPKWTLSGGIDLYYAYLQGQTPGLNGQTVTVSNSGVVIGGRLMSQLQLKNGWGLQAFGGMRGNQVQLQGTQGSFYMYSLGVRKDFNSKKGSVGIAAENFLANGMRIRTALNSPTFSQVNTNQLMNQNLKVTFSYKIGKMTMQAPRHKKSVSNDDVKGGEGGGEGGNQQQAAPAAAPAAPRQR
ncbi:MAG: TonB-dependent receptor [Cytophagaceae bacterium]|nr:TonB-dependent receptor [Cytophagaceae bacterium]